MSQPRGPDGRFTQTQTDNDHNLLLAALASRSNKHGALLDAMFPSTPTPAAQSPSPVSEVDPEMVALAFPS